MLFRETNGYGSSMPQRKGGAAPRNTKSTYWLMFRFTAFFMLVACMQVCARSNAQEKITLNRENIPFRQLLKEIKNRSGYLFVYKDDILRGIPNKNIHTKEAKLKDVMEAVLQGTGLTYSIIDKTVVLKRAVVVSAKNNPDSAFANEVAYPPIHGQVTDSTGTPLPNVAVMVKGTKYITVTDNNGNYTFADVDPADAILVFSFVGYGTQEIALQGETEIDVVLKVKVKELEELGVVVSTGYQQIPKERATGSFTQIDNKLFNRAIGSDILSHLQGVTNGLLFDSKSGNANGITVRGKSTIYSGTSPLIVVDNFPYVGELSSLNPNDVESVTVLKDAAAASIWGSSAGNGVIVITTKKGKLNRRAKLSLTSNLTFAGKPDLYYQPQLSSSEYLEVEQFLFNKGYYNSNISTGYTTISPAVQIMLDRRNGVISAKDSASRMASLATQDVREDLNKYFYRNSLVQQYNLNVSGGGPTQSYYLSAGYDNNRSSTVGTSNDRITLNANNSYNLLDGKLKIDANIAFNKSNTKDYKGLMPFSVDYPYEQFADSNGNVLAVASSQGLNPAYTDTAGGGYLLEWGFRPLDELRHKYNTLTQSTTDIRVNSGISYKIFPFLSAAVNYQYYQTLYDQLNDYDENSYYTRNRINSLSQIDWTTGTVTRPIPLGDILNRSHSQTKSHYGRAQLNFDKAFGGKHAVTAIVGFEVRQDKSDYYANNVYGYDANSATGTDVDYLTYFRYYYKSSTTRISSGNNQGYSEDHNRSYYGNIAYAYDEKYLLTGSLRKDESNLFGVAANQKGVPLGHIGIGWNMSNERFYKINWLPFLKLTATYGFNGLANNSISALLTSKYYGQNAWGSQAYSIGNPPNPSLRWEKVKNINLGMEFSTIGDILSGTVEYYIKNGEDLIGTSPIAPQTGITSFTGNSANTKAHGWDIQLTSSNIRNKYINWSTSFILNINKNKVSKYGASSGSNTNIIANSISAIEGYPINSIFAFKWEGLDSKGNPQGLLNNIPSIDYGNILNGNDTSALIYRGPAQPVYYGSIMNTISFKGVELSFNIIYKFKYFIRRNSLNYSNLYGGNIYQPDFAKRWQNPGDENTTNVPSMLYPRSTTRDLFYSQSDVMIEKGDNIKLQDVRLSYDLKERIGQLPFSAFRINCYMNNVCLLWKANKQYMDPNISSGYPLARTLAFGISASF